MRAFGFFQLIQCVSSSHIFWVDFSFWMQGTVFSFLKKNIFEIRWYICNYLVCNAWIDELKRSLVMLLKVGLYRIKRENQFQRSNRFPIYLICTVVMFFSFWKKKYLRLSYDRSSLIFCLSLVSHTLQNTKWNFSVKISILT